MGSYLLVFTVAAVMAGLAMPLAMAVGARVGALDDTRVPAVPRVGGWALAVGVAGSLALVGVVFLPTGLTLLAATRSVGPVTVGALVILGLGTIDDTRPVRAVYKLVGQVAVAAAVYAAGVRIEIVSFPVGAVELGPILGAIFTVTWLVGITNAFNLLDGADGVAAGSAFFAATAVFIMSVVLQHPGIGLVTAALAGALLGFLPYNFPPARAFLGDSGSMSAGFLLAGLAVEGSTKGPTLVAIAVPLVAFGVPVFDTTITLLRRIVRGHSPFRRDAEHLHHRLARVGFSPRQVAGLIYAASAGFALLSMLFINPSVRSIALVLTVVGGTFLFVVRFLRLHEMNELGRLARRGVLQPRSVVMNVQLRRAAERLDHAATFDDLLQALSVLFRRSEFDRVMVGLRPRGRGIGDRYEWHLDGVEFVEGRPERAPDEWEVVCPFEGGDWRGEFRLRRRLGRRALMIDLNLLLEVVQPALNRALARVGAPVAPVP